MSKKNLQIHSENILPIIKKWLYSDKDIFIRELVSNACDAIYKLKILRDMGVSNATDDEFKISVSVDKEKKTLTFTDTGIGMDAEEVEKYIAQIAFSGAEDFMEKYKTNQEGDQIIGHFGLGFYSSYMVANKVEIQTLSYKEGAKPAFWSCDGSSEYELSEGTRKTRGTEITLYINEESEEYLSDATLRRILNRYCSFLPYPVQLGESLINEKEPLWVKNPSDCTDEEYLEFYRHLYPMEEDPLFWVHLNVDYPFHLKGILYFPKVRREFDMNKTHIKLFCNRVFVSEDCKDLIPNYLTVLRGVLDSTDIPLNVSRSYLQMDRTVRQLGSHISKKVSESLATLYRTDRERFIKAWKDASLVVKLGILEDEKFYDRTKGFLIWKNLNGEWTTAEDYLERNRSKTEDKIIYTVDEDHNSPFIKLYKEKEIEILAATESYLDSHVMHFLEEKLAPAKFQRLDAGIQESLLDKNREKTILDAEGKTEAGKLSEFFRRKLDGEQVEVEAKSFASDALPGFLLLDENHRRMRDYMKAMSRGGHNFSEPDFFGKKTFVINTNNPLISSIMKLDAKDPELAEALVHQVYRLALLSQKELDPGNLQEFVAKNTDVLEKLTAKLAASIEMN